MEAPGIGADAAALLLAGGVAGASRAESAAIVGTMTEAGAMWTEQSTDDAEAEALFDARRLAYPALERLGPVLTEDICVPGPRSLPCWDRSTRSRPGTACGSPRSRTPATGTCIR